jgi:hypothetical protein
VAPFAVSVVVDPEQIVPELAEAVTVGVGFTVNVITSIPIHPLFSPVTVYVAVEVGLSTVEAVIAPELHEYVTAPFAVSVELNPVQIDAGLALAVTVGVVVTFNVITSIPVHPPLSPVTV